MLRSNPLYKPDKILTITLGIAESGGNEQRVTVPFRGIGHSKTINQNTYQEAVFCYC